MLTICVLNRYATNPEDKTRGPSRISYGNMRLFFSVPVALAVPTTVESAEVVAAVGGSSCDDDDMP
jgi:hypothetical protein